MMLRAGPGAPRAPSKWGGGVHLTVHEGGVSLFVEQGAAGPLRESYKHTRKGGETPTFPTFSSARTARQTQPFFFTPACESCSSAPLVHACFDASPIPYKTGSEAAPVTPCSCSITRVRSDVLEQSLSRTCPSLLPLQSP